MKVLLLNGSPHAQGCTNAALSLIAAELNAAGIDTEILHVAAKPVGGCVACGGCGRPGANGCVFGGVVNEAIEKAKTADAFVFGSPVYYAGTSGSMTAFMERLFMAGGKNLAYKPFAICCSARRAGTTTTLDQLAKYPQLFHMPMVTGSYWPMVHGSNAAQVPEDAEGCRVMQDLGRNMAWLLRCIEAGKAAGIAHPENPPLPRTNFVR
jgi:multimeric flavodoxin WrbA